MILSNVITAGDQSTFIKCLSDNDDSAVNDIRNYAQSVGDRVKDPAVKKNLDDAAAKLKEIYSKSVYCVHCGKLATMETNNDDKALPPLKFTCSCDGAKKEIEDKAAILKERTVIEEKYAKLQNGIINDKCLPVFKDHYKEIMKLRYADFMEYDNCILNLTAIEDGESK